MGLLDQLWDETVAGPRPDSGLGKLRNYYAQGGQLEEASPETQDGHRRRAGGRRRRRAEKPHRLRLGGHQFVGPMNYSAIQRGEKVLKNLKKQNNQSSRGISMTKEAS
ncbi:Os08g0453200 [Oryza sativa Japonica Group]|uniref:Os08g0453200 protein n=2 Tax=Oryza sativa subsp. japonica TaxID=39947 RepID=Q0J596_ORYSJ|nr:unknown protein [Oryza sativa Japonica Group]BAF23869.1 Os08g0453200 [Oryza sativa Japonica Group]BAG90675.1 unnamed protein product [Oryza sativa Japonica Group]|eukprot:NP_001061955.1 Os08g0453200 [Oryza sativa Japonica Group]